MPDPARNPWIPSLDGKVLPPCRLYDAVVDDERAPGDADEAWSQMAVYPSLPRAKAPIIWEAVLAIWRLKEEQKLGMGSVVWRQHLLAWLVRPIPPRSSTI